MQHGADELSMRVEKFSNILSNFQRSEWNTASKIFSFVSDIQMAPDNPNKNIYWPEVQKTYEMMISSGNKAFFDNRFTHFTRISSIVSQMA